MKKSKLAKAFTALGVLLLTAALGLTFYNMYDSRRAAEISSIVVNELMERIGSDATGKTSTEDNVLGDKQPPEGTVGETAPADDGQLPDHVLYPEKEMPTVLIRGVRYVGYLEIPKLGLTLPVAGGEWSYEKMKDTPCLYYGSAYTDDMIIAGHNYYMHFGRLDNLVEGDTLRFTDVNGTVFEYTVGWFELIDGEDEKAMLDAEDSDLTLFTCNFSGEQRITLRCMRK